MYITATVWWNIVKWAKGLKYNIFSVMCINGCSIVSILCLYTLCIL